LKPPSNYTKPKLEMLHNYPNICLKYQTDYVVDDELCCLVAGGSYTYSSLYLCGHSFVLSPAVDLLKSNAATIVWA